MADRESILIPEKFEILRLKIVISSCGGRRALPCAFTEQGVAMLSGANAGNLQGLGIN